MKSLAQQNDLLVEKEKIHDSIVYREKVVHDTVFITKEVYRDAQNSKFKIQNSSKTDTVLVTEYRDRVVELPPERYVPKFYKWCTAICFVLLAAIVVYIVFRLKFPR